MTNLESKLEELKPYLRDVVIVYIIDRENNRVLWGERKKKDRPGLGKRVGLGGGIEAGETDEEAVYREVTEEAGPNIKLKNLEKVGLIYFLFPDFKDSPGFNQRCTVFRCDFDEGYAIETTDIKPEWIPLDQLPEIIWDDNKYWVPKALKGEQVNGIFLFDKDNKVLDYQLKS